MNPPERKLRTVNECRQPHPDEGPIALILWRLEKLEGMVGPIMEEFHRRSGALQLAKYLGAALAGGLGVLTMFLDHFHLFVK